MERLNEKDVESLAFLLWAWRNRLSPENFGAIRDSWEPESDDWRYVAKMVLERFCP